MIIIIMIIIIIIMIYCRIDSEKRSQSEDGIRDIYTNSTSILKQMLQSDWLSYLYAISPQSSPLNFLWFLSV